MLTYPGLRLALELDFHEGHNISSSVDHVMLDARVTEIGSSPVQARPRPPTIRADQLELPIHNRNHQVIILVSMISSGRPW